MAARCEQEDEVARRSIYILHHGMMRPRKDHGCDLFSTWGGDCDQSLQMALVGLGHKTLTGCYLPRQDIVVPPSMYEFYEAGGKDYRSPYTNEDLRGLERSSKLYYAGNIGGWVIHKRQAGIPLRRAC